MMKRVYIYMLVIVCSMFIFGCDNNDSNELKNNEIVDNSSGIDKYLVDKE